jgi:hypothetical protein
VSSRHLDDRVVCDAIGDGHPVLRGPCSVMKLRDGAVATQREHRVAHGADEKTDNDHGGKHSSNLHLVRWKASLNGGSRELLHVVMREPAVESQKGSRCGIRAVMCGPGHCCPVTFDTANAWRSRSALAYELRSSLRVREIASGRWSAPFVSPVGDGVNGFDECMPFRGE